MSHSAHSHTRNDLVPILIQSASISEAGKVMTALCAHKAQPPLEPDSDTMALNWPILLVIPDLAPFVSSAPCPLGYYITHFSVFLAEKQHRPYLMIDFNTNDYFLDDP
jgi:hypothetical protein